MVDVVLEEVGFISVFVFLAVVVLVVVTTPFVIFGGITSPFFWIDFLLLS